MCKAVVSKLTDSLTSQKHKLCSNLVISAKQRNVGSNVNIMTHVARNVAAVVIS